MYNVYCFQVHNIRRTGHTHTFCGIPEFQLKMLTPSMIHKIQIYSSINFRIIYVIKHLWVSVVCEQFNCLKGKTAVQIQRQTQRYSAHWFYRICMILRLGYSLALTVINIQNKQASISNLKNNMGKKAFISPSMMILLFHTYYLYQFFSTQ